MNDVNEVEANAEVTVPGTVPRLHLVVVAGTASVLVALVGAVVIGTTVATDGMIEMVEATSVGDAVALQRGRAGGAHPLTGGGMIGLGPRQWMTSKSRTKEMTGHRRPHMTIELHKISCSFPVLNHFATCDKNCSVVPRLFDFFVEICSRPYKIKTV